MRGRARGKGRQQFEEQPATDTIDDLTGQNFAASSPVFGTPTLVDATEVLTGQDFAASSPAFGSPTLADVTPPNPGDSIQQDTGSGNFTVPNYATLTIEIWGHGTGGQGQQVGAAGCVAPAGTPGATTATCAAKSLSMTANGGGKGTSASYNQAGPSGGTASGGNTTNTTGGSAGGSASSQQPAQSGGAGGTAPNGGAGGAAVTSNEGPFNGLNGTAPGGGGSGSRVESTISDTNSAFWATGGASGGYSKSIFVKGVTSGAPDIGDIIAWAVSNAAVTGGNFGSGTLGGDGANGRVKITVA